MQSKCLDINKYYIVVLVVICNFLDSLKMADDNNVPQDNSNDRYAKTRPCRDCGQQFINLKYHKQYCYGPPQQKQQHRQIQGRQDRQDRQRRQMNGSGSLARPNTPNITTNQNPTRPAIDPNSYSAVLQKSLGRK
jgi:hypothetical protein